MGCDRIGAECDAAHMVIALASMTRSIHSLLPNTPIEQADTGSALKQFECRILHVHPRALRFVVVLACPGRAALR